ncbi:hypothetical protein CAPTEDRAFT_138365 [Capitella teleta]|uniref:Sulfatase N-terminal domain-containing protein n=1 Tax=Capitella teleta TaxID=283909 RepID=R7VI54_CAPTE|nr:hypothetical protein CAPTEDRAFT_138365 [Capitella teleta]|eukprot:ELU18212.1 hypothetical protein CAPTEDRAFT_138365 [Capitella teleta]
MVNLNPVPAITDQESSEAKESHEQRFGTDTKTAAANEFEEVKKSDKLPHEVGNTTNTALAPEFVEVKKGNEEQFEADYAAESTKKPLPNFLFLIADDMRPEIGAYKDTPWINSQMKTPNLDKLASKSLLFKKAYCQQSWCNPSRASFLTSRRPETTMVHNNSVFVRQNIPNVVTMPQYFKQAGYHTLGMGKVFHLLNTVGDSDDDYSWSEPTLRVGSQDFFDESSKLFHPVGDDERNGRPLLDEFVTMHAKKALYRVADKALSGEQPFFMAVGMKKPHLPFVFPESFLKFYPKNSISQPINPYVPENLPRVAWAPSNEVSGRAKYAPPQGWGFNHTFSEETIIELRRGYYSSVTYIDSLLGEILQELEDLGLSNNTIVSFIGDHGYHLGEQSIIGKNTNFEVANNSPMMISVPGETDNGRFTEKLVEFVDLFPTLVELAGFNPLPICPRHGGSKGISLCTEGSSLVPLIYDKQTNWKERVFFQYPKYLGAGEEFCMGYSMRTAKYRYTEWVSYNYAKEVGPDWDSPCAVELYDHDIDPNEMVNIADEENMEQIRMDLSTKLKDGWHAALPS